MASSLPIDPSSVSLQGVPDVTCIDKARNYLTWEAVNTNNAMMMTFFDRMTIAPESSRSEGALTKKQKLVSEEWKRRADQSDRHIESLSLLRETDRASSGSRDLFSSTFSDEDTVASYSRDYSIKYESFGRSYASTSSLQNMTRRLRHAVCDPRAEDWDIKNCMFTLTVQMAHQMQIDLNIAEAKLPT